MSENSYLITLLQKENQTIIAYELNDKGEYTGVSHTESFFAKANSKWKFSVIPDKFHDDYWIHIIQSDHQTITVRDNARFHDYRAGILVSYPDDDKLTGIQAGDLDSGIYPETNYDVAGEEPHDRYKYLVVNQNCRIFATLARDLYNNTDYHTISIKQVKHQTIVLTYRNKKYYTDTIVENNEDYTVELIPDHGYTATSLIINGKTINSLKHTGKATEDLAITAVQSQANVDSNYLEFIFKEFDSRIERFNNSDGKLLVGTLQYIVNTELDKKTYKISIIQSDNQTIHVYVPQKNGGTDHTSSFSCLEGTKYEVEVIADNGYTAGIPNTKSGIVNRDMVINATPATKSNVTITIIQSANQTISVYSVKNGQTFTSTFETTKGDNLRLNIEPSVGYRSGDLLLDGVKCTPNTIQYIDNSHTVSATAAVALQYTLTIKQSEHQTITVTANGKTYTNNVSLPYGTTYTVSITADAGYVSGELNKTSGTITGDDIINATPAIKVQIYIAKGSAPWYYSKWIDASHIIKTDETISGQATVTCEGVTSMNSMFEDCHSLTSLNLSNFDTSKITDMNHMFYSCRNLALLDISNFNTSKVTDMAYMFNYCRSLASIDVSSFNTSNVTNMYAMFEYCSNLTSLDLSNFDTSNVTDMGYMFRYCSSLTSIKGMINMKHCESFVDMFYDCPKLRDVKIKNPPSGFNGAGLSKSQYTLYYDNT